MLNNMLNHVPPTPGQLLGALRGPLILITLGTLLAIDHAGGLRIVRSWPILIIAFGLLKLAEFALGSAPPASPGQSSPNQNGAL